MKTALRYLRYGLEKSLWRTIIFTVISVAITFMITRSATSGSEDRYKSTGIYMLAIMISVFAAIIPMLELSEFKNRRNLDTLYFFPIERKSMALVHFVSGFIQLAVIYTVTFASGFLYLLLTTSCFALGYMIPYYFATLAIGLVMYSFFCFTFSQGNTVADGVIISLLWVLVAYVVFAVLFDGIIWDYIYDRCIDKNTYEVIERERNLYNAYKNVTGCISDWSHIFAPINNVTVIFQRLIEVNRYSYNTSAARYIQHWYMFIVWGGIGIAAAIGYIIGFGRRSAHLAGEISNSWFAYKTLIPIYGYSLFLLLGGYNTINYLFVLAAVLMFIGYVIYRRSFKIKKCDVIMLVCSIIPFIIGVLTQ